ncbi:MAG: peptide/nickel transport system permease protein, partial [Thermomicrobiales bacterium]|nr:peptide/nickel transport system permease protein [Thermomicrobiales bacterium]
MNAAGTVRTLATATSGAPPSPRSPWALVRTRFTRHRLALASAIVLSVLALSAVCAPMLARHDPNATDLLNRNTGPSLDHFLGTDSFGRDVWARLIFAARISLSVGIVAVGLYTFIGILLGALAGYYGGLIDGTIMRFTDTVMSFPSLILIILAVSIIGISLGIVTGLGGQLSLGQFALAGIGAAASFHIVDNTG